MIPRSFSLSCRAIQARYPQRVKELIGDADRIISRVHSPDTSTANDIAFCATSKSLKEGLASSAGALAIAPAMREAAIGFVGTIIICDAPDVWMAEFIQDLVLRTPYRDSENEKGVHPSAHLHPLATIAPSAYVGPGACIARGARIGERCFIGANSIIEADATIGDDSVIHPLAYIGHSTSIGKRCEIYPNATIGKEGFGYATDARGQHHKIAHQGIVVLEDDVHVGSSSTIDRATFVETRVGAGTKIDNHVHLAHNCKVGRGGILTMGFAMAGSSEVGSFFVAGGRSNVTGHVKVGDGVRIAALAAIGKSFDAPGEYGGVPLVPLRQHLKIKAALAQLPEMRDQVAKLMKRVFEQPNKQD